MGQTKAAYIHSIYVIEIRSPHANLEEKTPNSQQRLQTQKQIDTFCTGRRGDQCILDTTGLCKKSSHNCTLDVTSAKPPA